MTHFRKSLGLLGVSLSLIGGAIVVDSTETANAATWHKGIPSTFKTHKYWVTKSKVKTEYGKNYYGRKYITFSYRNKIWSITRFDAMYYKDGKGYINNNFINYDSGEGTPYLAYAKTKKNTYELKRTKQMSGWPERHYRFQKSGSTYKVWTRSYWNHIDPNVASNRTEKKWTKVGNFSILKKSVRQSTLDKKDPLK